nr:plasmid partitioning/stability family protein [Erwinia mallotivora]
MYMHPEEETDALGLEVLESVSQRTRGDFLRTAVLAGCALHQIDRRLPVLLANLFDGTMTPGQLVNLIRQTTGWKPDEAEIRDVVAALGGVSGGGEPATTSPEPETSRARQNMRQMFRKEES